MASDYLVLQVTDGTDPLSIKEYVIEPHLKEKYDISTRSVIRGSREENLLFSITPPKTYKDESEESQDYIIYKDTKYYFTGEVSLAQYAIMTVVKRTNIIFGLNRVVNEVDTYFYYNDIKYYFAGSIDLSDGAIMTVILRKLFSFGITHRILTADTNFYYKETEYTFTDEVNLIA